MRIQCALNVQCGQALIIMMMIESKIKVTTYSITSHRQLMLFVLIATMHKMIGTIDRLEGGVLVGVQGPWLLVGCTTLGLALIITG